MRQMLKLWNDDCGSGLLSAEWLFLFAILVLGIITGLVAVRQALISELTESAQALLALNQSFSFSGQSNCESSTAGSQFTDAFRPMYNGATPPLDPTTDQGELPCD